MSFGARSTGYSAPAGPNASLPATLTVQDETFQPTTATASFTLNSDGTYSSVGSLFAPSGTWQTGTGTGSSYEARLTVTSGSFSSGTTGSWLVLSTNRTWTNTRSGSPGSATGTGTLEIRDAVTLSVLTSSTLTVTAFMDF